MRLEDINILSQAIVESVKPLMQEIESLKNEINKPKQIEQEKEQEIINKVLAEMRPVVGNGDTRGAGYSQSYYDDLVR